ncbi:MAG: TldD/PmbA family protein [Candidatus Binataceae bacterium]
MSSDYFRAIEFLTSDGEAALASFARTNRAVAYADLRFEVVHSVSGSAVNGEPRENEISESAAFGISVHVANRGGAFGHGQCGVEVGALALDRNKLLLALNRGLAAAHDRARVNAQARVAALKHTPSAAHGLVVGAFEPRAAIRDDVAAHYRRDPREISAAEIGALALDASRSASAVGREIAFNAAAALTELRHELFISTEGSLVAQAFAFSQGDCYVVAESGDGHQELFDTIGQQRGIESLAEGWRDELMPNPDFAAFATALAREARELAAAPALKPPDAEVTVVTDPYFNALLSHEIVGHPCEADRALKMEAAYAGRSWLLRSATDNEIGHQVGSHLLSACSDPLLNGYGHYLYDHEGTRGVRVMHIDRGVFRGFINSRATAAALGVEPNGSMRASEAWHVPLIRMSNTFFLPGESLPEKLIADVDRGYFVCGHQIPSIAESRENFRISARRVYEIEHGRIGQLFRSGSVISDSRRFFMNVDGVGNDLRLVAIPNCGKGQPMQVKRMSNGGPTLRSRARLGGGA